MRMEFRDVDGNLLADYVDGQLTLYEISVPATLISQSPQGWEDVTAVDYWLRTWTISDRKVMVDGQPYHWGVADHYLMWDDDVWSFNEGLPPPNQYVRELTDEYGSHLSWSQPMPDPRVSNPGPDPIPPGSGDTLVTRGSIQGNIITVTSNPGFSEGDGIIIPATQPRGHYGPGGTYPERLFATESDINSSIDSIDNGEIVGVIQTGLTYYKRDGQMISLLYDEGHWYVGHIVPKAYFAYIERIDGNRWTMSKHAVVDVSDVDIFYDASNYVMHALDNGGNVNLNKIFPNWKRAAINGQLVPDHASNVHLTCDSKGSFELFSPKGCPTLSIEWLSPHGCLSDSVTLRGNVGDQGYGLGWEDTSTRRYGQHGPLTSDWLNSWLACFPPGHVFRQGVSCVHQDAEVIDAFVLATGGHGCGDSHSYRIKMTQNEPLREYVQWHAQYASTQSRCSLVDIEVDSKRGILPAFEIMHGQGDIINPHGRNYTMAMNNASGRIVGPRIKLDAGILQEQKYYPIYRQSFYGAPLINLNKNSADWATSNGITLVSPVIEQPEELDDEQGNMIGVNVQELPNFRLEGGMKAVYPAQLKRGNGAVGIQSYAPGGYFDGKIDVQGECINERNCYPTWIVNDPQAGPSLEIPPNGHFG